MNKIIITLIILASLLWPSPLVIDRYIPSLEESTSICKFPCFTAEHKKWVSQKRLTEKKTLGSWRLKRHSSKDPKPKL